ncbi:small multi-drug export protein [Alkalihalobacterium alkalinitrilicum]|uniref:small multi-drug export protein n=1 Tax=Alkalihalobacterium alkalinitrilicum TaxID=427920 RepID=UPI0009948F06|nr:small multi-drug export protein [Alkalihalobacterium alkalinitrilicum]
MNETLGYVMAFLLAATPFFEMVAVIPLGVISGLELVSVTVVAFLGNLLTVLIVVIMMTQIKAWLQKRREAKGKDVSSKRQNRAKRIWQRYGLFGLCFIGPILIGSHLAVIMGMTFGGTKKQMSIFMTGSLFLWAIVTAVATHMGVEWFF